MEKIKQFIISDTGKDIMYISIVILVGIAGFCIGRLSVSQVSSRVKIEYSDSALRGSDQEAAASVGAENAPKSGVPAISANKAFFASSRGKKYYTATCAAGKGIKPENRVYFGSSAAAESAGYALSTSCH